MNSCWLDSNGTCNRFSEGMPSESLPLFPFQEPWLWLEGSGPCQGQWKAPGGSRQKTLGTFMTSEMCWARESQGGGGGAIFELGMELGRASLLGLMAGEVESGVVLSLTS